MQWCLGGLAIMTLSWRVREWAANILTHCDIKNYYFSLLCIELTGIENSNQT